MEKRVDRNRKLYEEVNKQIIEYTRKNDTAIPEETSEILRNAAPELFGQSKKNQPEPIKEKSKINKNIIIYCLVFLILVILIILIAVVVNYGK